MINCRNNGFTLTSVIGTFEFECDTIMSHAKAVRDFMLGVVLGQNDDGLRPPKPHHAQRFVHEHMNGPAKYTQFAWRP